MASIIKAKSGARLLHMSAGDKMAPASGATSAAELEKTFLPRHMIFHWQGCPDPHFIKYSLC